MNFRSYGVLFGLFVFLTLTPAALPIAAAQSSSAFNLPASGSNDFMVNHLTLEEFEAAAGNMSACSGDSYCLKHAKRIKAWVCVAAICDGTDKGKEPISCFEGATQEFPLKVSDQIDSAICAVIKSPSPATRKEALLNVPNDSESHLVEHGAFLLALKGSASACEDYIKSYVGPYGPSWNYRWYRAMSGCRILAHQTTRQQEVSDFATWFGVVQGTGNCSSIVNNEMRNACSAPGAASPIPTNEH